MNKLFQRNHDPIWHAQLALLLVVCLQVFTNSALLPFNKFAIVVLELLLIAVLTFITPAGYGKVSGTRRALGIGLIGFIATVNIVSLVLLLSALFFDNSTVDGRDLLLNGLIIYATNIIMFALLYWEMDGGGPVKRAIALSAKEDFVFPQMLYPHLFRNKWRPGFMDYLYLSGTNVTNFASADSMPVTRRAKMMMMTQALVSVVTIVLVAARAISILQ
ncbi:MAG: hypothetical protein ABIR91_02725 [Candidatus Saccharimonadales bacterium]